MNKNIKYIIGLVGLAIILAIGLSFFNNTEEPGPGKYDGFATCLTEKGAIFYGAFWCPHCRDQKKLFGKSAKLINYVECSTPDASGQLQVCIDKKIEGYPTWEFADGSRVSKGMSLQELSDKTSCSITEVLPAETSSTTPTNK